MREALLESRAMTLDLQLDPHEARVLGVLIEKDLTTPEQYPLTLNSLTLGANQKSNRDPVLSLMESQVYAALQKLIRKGLAGSIHPAGARVEKFRHNAQAILKCDASQIAVLAELLMRGPQQPGELRGRASRMTPIDTLQALMDVLKPLIEMGYVARLDPTPGSRAERFVQMLSPGLHPIETRYSPPVLAAHAANASTSTVTPPTQPTPAANAPSEEYEKRIVELEVNVVRLRRQLDNLAWKLGEKLEG